MFSDCVLMALLEKKDKSMELRRIVEDRDTQAAINSSFSSASLAITKDRTPISFNGKYHPQPDDMEYLFIDNYALPEKIKEALINPQGLDVYMPENDSLLPIRALLLGKCEDDNGEHQFTVAFQKFKNDQYITASKHHLFFTGNTFIKDKRLGISVSHIVDCFFQAGKLVFSSYFFARQVLDLSAYYREASNQDVQDFIDAANIHMDNGAEFVTAANSWERRKIASINDSGVLKDFKATEIKSRAKKCGVELTVSSNQIVLPTDKAERRIVLGFLDEEVYKGVFSEKIFQTNSKREA